jgi:hypothetical protein
LIAWSSVASVVGVLLQLANSNDFTVRSWSGSGAPHEQSTAADASNAIRRSDFTILSLSHRRASRSLGTRNCLLMAWVEENTKLPRAFSVITESSSVSVCNVPT